MFEVLLCHMHLKRMTSKTALLQRYYDLGPLKASFHWLSASGVFAWLAWRLRRVTHWSLCLPAWGTFSLVAVRLKPCLSCIYPLFIWRMSSAYSVWGGIVCWLLRSVVNASAVFFSCFSRGMSRFFYTHICEKRCPNSLKNLTEIGWNTQMCAALMLFLSSGKKRI